MKSYLVALEAIQQLQNLPSFREHSANEEEKNINWSENNWSVVFSMCVFDDMYLFELVVFVYAFKDLKKILKIAFRYLFLWKACDSNIHTIYLFIHSSSLFISKSIIFSLY